MQGLRQHWKPALLLTLILSGLVLQKLDLIQLDLILQTMRDYTHEHWLLMVIVLILYQVILFMFALPGSTALWLVAPIYPPVMAVIILTTGGLLGGIGAYFFSRHLGENWQQRIRQHRIFHSLEQRGDALTLLSLRILPGFPHSVINYAAGMLRLPLLQFCLTAIIGLGIKNAIYCVAIYKAVSLGLTNPQISYSDFIPLLLLTLLLIGVRIIQVLRNRNK